MHILEVSSPRNASIHLTTFRELERHCHNESKHAGYERMLNDFGIDEELFSTLTSHPRLVMAEQPGCWFYGDDLMRFRLFTVLTETLGFSRSSGVLSLASDAFTCRGLKKSLLMLELGAGLQPVPLVGAAYIRRHRNRAYSALNIEGSACERMAAILEACLVMLGSAQVSPDVFAEEVTGMFRAGVRSGIRPMLPARSDKRSLRELAGELRELDLEAASVPFAGARQALCDGVPWGGYWDRVNGAFFGTRIGQLGPLLNRFLLTVKDPVLMCRNLIRLCLHPAGKPIAVAGIFVNGEKYRMVFFDPDTAAFFYRPALGSRREIAWSDIRTLAEGDRTGGPSGTLEYLLMAANGIYLLADPDDGYNRFERLAREIHVHYTGLPYPCVAFASSGTVPALTYLQIYASDYEAKTRGAIERFFE